MAAAAMISSSDPMQPGDSYRPLATPLPSHPGLRSHASSLIQAVASSSLSSSSCSSQQQQQPGAAPPAPQQSSGRIYSPGPATGALSAISSLWLGGRARHPKAAAQRWSSSQPAHGKHTARSSSLLTRRGHAELTDNFSLEPRLNNFGRIPENATEDGDDDDVPPLQGPIPELKTRPRSRMSSAHNGDDADHDLPPSPVGLPGAWFDDRNTTNGALLLPPPFLDESSSKQSFEGLLGTREARARQSRLRKEMRNYAKDRPLPPQFPRSLLNTASKLVTALGPPGGVDSGSYYRAWKDDPDDPTPGSVRKDRRRVQRANSAMKGFEVGEKYARKLADRLRAERTRYLDPAGREHYATVSDHDRRDELDTPAAELFLGKKLVAATPMSLLQAASSVHVPASPPLLGFPTPALSFSTSTATPTTDPITPSAPPKASLRPIIDDSGEPSPLPLLPDEEPKPPSPSGAADGYFAIRRRRSARRPARAVSITTNGDRPIPLSRSSALDTGSLLDDGADVISPLDDDDGESEDDTPSSPDPTITVGGFALPRIETRSRPNFDLMVWILVGSPDISSGLDQGLASVGGLLGIVLHFIGFIVFVLVHTWALGVSLCATIRSIVLFSHWTFLNLTGRTDLSIVAKEYFALCQKEWNTVSAEDGVRLSVGSVLLGLFELMAVQAISKERWIAHGPGHLVLVNSDEPLELSSSARKGSLDGIPALSGALPTLFRRSTKRRSLGSDRPHLSRRGTSRRWTVDDGEGLIVTGGGDSILEGTIYNECVDPLAYASPSFTPHPGSATGANTGIPALDELDDLPPLELGDSMPNDTLPGFSFPPSPHSFVASPTSPPMKPLPDVQDEATAFVTLLQRHARLATASYGLHTYILAPPTPLFTPSGATLPHRVFSHLGGVDHKAVLHVAIQKHYTGVPVTAGEDEESMYEPQFYLLRDDLHGEVVCVVRGTQSLADIRTDLEAGLEPVDLPSLDPSSPGRETFAAHAGILAAARRLLEPSASPLFAKLKTALEDHPGYSLILTGHSLGAAIASTMAFLVGQYTPDGPSKSATETEVIGGPTASTHATTPSNQARGHWTISSSSGLPASRPVRAICFAHPATVSLPLARRCSFGQVPLVLSVSLGPDAVCRMGIPQVREVRRVLGRLAKHRRKWLKLQRTSGAEVEDSPPSDGDEKVSRPRKGIHGKSEILTAWWRWKKLQGGIREVDLDPKAAAAATILTEEERQERRMIEDKAWRWRCEMDGIEDVEQHPQGKDEKTLSTRMIPCGKAYHIDRLPVEVEKQRRREMAEEREREKAERERAGDEDDEDDEEDTTFWGLYEVGSPDAFYACPHLEADLVKAHLPKEYLDAVNSL